MFQHINRMQVPFGKIDSFYKFQNPHKNIHIILQITKISIQNLYQEFIDNPHQPSHSTKIQNECFSNTEFIIFWDVALNFIIYLINNFILQNQMKRILPKHSGSKVSGRANSKGVTINNRHYVIGGFSQTGIEMNVPSFIVTNRNPYEIEWRVEQIKNLEILTPRDSFAIAAHGHKIYIFGGCLLQSGESTNELLELDIEKNSISRIETKGEKPPPMNSSRIIINALTNQLISFGGVSGEIKIPVGLYRLNLSTSQWTFQPLHLDCYEHGIWQHTCHFLEKPLELCQTVKEGQKSNQQKIVGLELGIKQNVEKILPHKIATVNIGQGEDFELEGKQIPEPPKNQEINGQNERGGVILLVGGCGHPNHPYSQVTQIQISTGQIVAQTFINGVTAHDSGVYKERLFVFGGSDGIGVSDQIQIVGKEMSIEKGYCGLGPLLFVEQNCIIVFGGINPSNEPLSFNNVLILYDN